MTVVACRQLAPVLGDVEGNVARALAAVAESVGAGADVVVLPELATAGYVFASADEARDCALPARELAGWSAALAGDTVAVVGFAELGDDDAVYNSAAVVDADGVRVVHRKAHLWDREKLWFAAGRDPAPVVDTAHGRIAVMVCYDLEFPEYTRDVALRGADLIAVPTNWPLVDRPSGERPPELLVAQAAARVNRVAIACCDRSGTERGQQWTEGTAVIGSDGWLVTGVGGDCFVELDLTAGRSKRLAESADLFADRRPELYGG